MPTGDDKIPKHVQASVELQCHVMLQKENTEKGTKYDEECGGPVNDGHAGLCE